MRIRDGGAKRDYIFFYFSLLKVGIKGICEDALFLFCLHSVHNKTFHIFAKTYNHIRIWKLTQIQQLKRRRNMIQSL